MALTLIPSKTTTAHQGQCTTCGNTSRTWWYSTKAIENWYAKHKCKTHTRRDGKRFR